jgi:single-stranded-DNA-specific exonuclease
LPPADHQSLPADLTPERPWREATKHLRAVLRRVPPHASITILASTQPDGLTAGVVLRRALRRAGWSVRLILPGKGQPVWDAALRDRLAGTTPGALLAVGLGSTATNLLAGVPTVLIDRRPLTAAPPATVISGATWRPATSTSLMAYWLGQAFGDVRRLDWVAAAGALATLGERTSLPLVVEAKKAYGGNWLREVVILLRAARRGATMPAGAAVTLLQQARDPKDCVLGERPDRDRLRAARAEVEAAVEAAKLVEPAASDLVTLVLLHDPCEVHGLLAQIWANRRPGVPVLIANSGYVPGAVAFTALDPTGSDWLARLERALPAAALVDDEREGAPPALHGQIAAAAWPALLRQLGLVASV